MRKRAAVVGAWITERGAQAALVSRFAPMTFRAYAALLRVTVSERLWRVPERAHPGLAPNALRH